MTDKIGGTRRKMEKQAKEIDEGFRRVKLIELAEAAYTAGWNDGCNNRGWNGTERRQRAEAIVVTLEML